MKLQLWIPRALLALSAAILVAVALSQRQTLTGLRTRLDRAQGARERAVAAAGALEPPSPAPAELSQAEKLEQARMRARVASLLARQRELADVDQENQRLRAELRHRQATPASQRLPVGYIRRSAAQLRGLDTPQHAFESFVWAVEQRDTNSLLQALQPDAAKQLADQLAKNGAEETFRELARIPGFAVTREERATEDKAELWLEFAPETEPVPMKLVRTNGQWRLWF